MRRRPAEAIARLHAYAQTHEAETGGYGRELRYCRFQRSSKSSSCRGARTGTDRWVQSAFDLSRLAFDARRPRKALAADSHSCFRHTVMRMATFVKIATGRASRSRASIPNAPSKA